MKEGLLVDLVGDYQEEIVMLSSERPYESEERGQPRLVQAIHSLFGWWIILEQLLKDILVFYIENLILECEQKFWSLVNGYLILQELQQRRIITVQTN
jgi:hypothetical protein